MRMLMALASVMALSASARAATITVSPGFNAATDLEVTVDGVLQIAGTAGFTVAIGSWDGATFTQFGNAIFGDTGSVNGVFAATGPAEVNSDVIFVYVGYGNLVSTSGGSFALFRTATDTAFPSDVSSVSASQTVNFHNSTPGNILFVGGSNSGFVSGNLALFSPEPSSLLMGALGLLCLLRRRRD